jgi:hypothetical protein
MKYIQDNQNYSGKYPYQPNDFKNPGTKSLETSAKSIRFHRHALDADADPNPAT